MRALKRPLFFAIAAGVCASAVWGLAALASDDPRAHRTIDVSRALGDAGPLATAPPDMVITKTPPDPTPLVAKSQWVFDLRWDRGDVWLLGARPLELPAAQPTPRAMGRFALELFEGAALIERVRFDFPLLGPPEADAGWAGPPSMSAKLRTRIGVVFPAVNRGTRLELWDRATGRRWTLPWPVDETAADSGTAASP